MMEIARKKENTSILLLNSSLFLLEKSGIILSLLFPSVAIDTCKIKEKKVQP
jgi:hypothetical protein